MLEPELNALIDSLRLIKHNLILPAIAWLGTSVAQLGLLIGAAPAAAPMPQTVGAHSLAFQRIDGGRAVVATDPMATRKTGTTIIVGVGRGDFQAFQQQPTDNMGNEPYGLVGVPRTYTNWPSSGTALYAFAGARGGEGHMVM